jgi:elongation factor Ts
MEITPAMVKALREKTGLPMMECKKALEETGGNPEAAMELLRKKGLAQVTKRAEKVTAEGRVVFYQDPASGRAALLEMLCETEPVSGTEDFQRLAREAVQAAAKTGLTQPEQLLEQPTSGGQKITDLLHDAVNRIRENIKVGRVATAQGHFGTYLHHDNKKGVLVEFSGPVSPDVAADVCMHIVAMRPPFVKREDVDANLISERKEAARGEVKGKPEHMVEKIVAGKLDKWYQDIVLLEQPFVKDDKKSVGQHLRESGAGLTVTRFVRLEIGEA